MLMQHTKTLHMIFIVTSGNIKQTRQNRLAVDGLLNHWGAKLPQTIVGQSIMVHYYAC